MSHCHSYIRCLLLCAAFAPLAICRQDTPASSVQAKTPLEHVIGTITLVDKAAQTVTVQEDKTGTVHLIQLAGAKTLLKVEPTAKDLKNATRITADDLEKGDRVDVRGTKLEDTPTTLNARSVILMSGRDLEQTHQQQAAAWSRAISGRVTAVDTATGKITADVRAAGAVKSVVIQTAGSTEFSRYSSETGKAIPSQISQIQTGDQLKVIGDKNEDESQITAQRVYTGAFRTISATISALAPDGKAITVKDLSTKKEVTVALNNDASIHKLPPMMAGFLARRLNPGAAATAGSPQSAGATPLNGPAGPQAGAAPPSDAPGMSSRDGAAGSGMQRGPGGMGGQGRGNGDISQMIERTPKITLADLKPGDAVVISGVATGGDNSHLLANTIIAGVEPILQSAPTQRGGSRNVGGDWGLGEMSAPQ